MTVSSLFYNRIVSTNYKEALEQETTEIPQQNKYQHKLLERQQKDKRCNARCADYKWLDSNTTKGGSQKVEHNVLHRQATQAIVVLEIISPDHWSKVWSV